VIDELPEKRDSRCMLGVVAIVRTQVRSSEQLERAKVQRVLRVHQPARGAQVGESGTHGRRCFSKRRQPIEHPTEVLWVCPGPSLDRLREHVGRAEHGGSSRTGRARSYTGQKSSSGNTHAPSWACVEADLRLPANCSAGNGDWVLRSSGSGEAPVQYRFPVTHTENRRLHWGDEAVVHQHMSSEPSIE